MVQPLPKTNDAHVLIYTHRYKKTVICQEVAKQKNVCQVCLLDLEYGLPVQVRDQALGIANDDEPESQVGKEFQLQKSIEEGNTSSSFAQSRPNELLARLQRTQPYYKVSALAQCLGSIAGYHVFLSCLHLASMS